MVLRVAPRVVVVILEHDELAAAQRERDLLLAMVVDLVVLDPGVRQLLPRRIARDLARVKRRAGPPERDEPVAAGSLLDDVAAGARRLALGLPVAVRLDAEAGVAMRRLAVELQRAPRQQQALTARGEPLDRSAELLVVRPRCAGVAGRCVSRGGKRVGRYLDDRGRIAGHTGIDLHDRSSVDAGRSGVAGRARHLRS
ncbi:MAG TPA: hypothetical protein VFQ53_17505 [Kofleriaceae bacterium]|nr:hypothetical protein [Kofleriaceae bacterium]